MSVDESISVESQPATPKGSPALPVSKVDFPTALRCPVSVRCSEKRLDGHRDPEQLPRPEDFAKIAKIIDIPNLINIQKQSLREVPAGGHRRRTSARTSAFRASSSRSSRSGTSTRPRSLEFVSYHLEKPKYDVDECHQRGMTYSAPIKVVVRLVVWDKDEETGAQSIRDVKEQEVYFGEIPLMTENGTFIINGTERVVVSQLHRSPGRVLRPRQGQEPLVGQAALQRPHHPVPRLVDRLRVRPQGPALRPHRPPPQAADAHGAA